MSAEYDASGKFKKYRMCGDYRALNEQTQANHYPMRRAEEIFDMLGGMTVFTTLDLRQGFNQIPIREDHKERTAFHGVNGGFWEWNVMPFGLRNASAIFQAAMDRILRGLSFAVCYIDDVIVFSRTVKEHWGHLREVLRRIREAGLRCHPEKAKFFQSTVEYLGHQVCGRGISPQQARVVSIQGLQPPKDLGALRTFLGIVGYYRRFIKDFSERAKPLTTLTKKEMRWAWGHEQQTAFQSLKDALSSAPVLGHPDWEKPFNRYTDWSKQAVGAVLTQTVG
jgi:hypothetical protein